MAALLTAVGLGCGRVIGVNATPGKLDTALQMGADEVWTIEDARRRGVHAPIVIEAAGHPQAFEAAVELTAPGGTTVTVGLPHPDACAKVSPAQLTGEARTITGCYLGSGVPSRDIPRYAELWEAGRLPVEKLISSRIRLDQIDEAMDHLAEGGVLRQVITFE